MLVNYDRLFLTQNKDSIMSYLYVNVRQFKSKAHSSEKTWEF